MSLKKGRLTVLFHKEETLKVKVFSEEEFVDKFKGSDITLSLTYSHPLERLDIRERLSNSFSFNPNSEVENIVLSKEDIFVVVEWANRNNLLRYQEEVATFKVFTRVQKNKRNNLR